MKRYPFPDNRLTRCFLALLLLALLMLSRDSLYGRYFLDFTFSQLTTVALLALTGAAFLLVRRKDLRSIFTDSRLLMALAAAVLMLVPMVLKQDWQIMYVSILVYILAAIMLSYFLDLQLAARYYLVVITVLGGFSVLATYFLRLLPDNGLLHVPVLTANDQLYYQFGLAAVPVTFVKGRNFGIFREPGIYQFFLLLGLYLNNYKAQWEKGWQVWVINGVLAITMLTTFATGGLIELGLLAIFLFIDQGWYRKRTGRIAACGLLAALAGAVAWILVTRNGLYVAMVGAFEKFGPHTDSGITRVGSIFVNLEIFLHHPLLGADIHEVLHTMVNNTSSTMIQYASFGIFTASLHVAGWFALAWDKKRNVFGNLFLVMILFMSFNTENLNGNPFFWLFPVLALMERLLPAADRYREKKRRAA